MATAEAAPWPDSPSPEAAAVPPPPSPEFATTLPPLLEAVVTHTHHSPEGFSRHPLPSAPAASSSRLDFLSSPTSMPSTFLAFYWVIETLAGCKQVEAYILRDLISSVPDFLTGAAGSVRKRVSLRFVEELVGMDRGEGPSEWASTRGINISQSCEEVLCSETMKFCRIARLFNLEKNSVNRLISDIQKFFLQKRDSLSVTSVEKIKADLMSLKENHSLPTQNEDAYTWCNSGDETQRVDNRTVLVNDADCQSYRLNSNDHAPRNCSGHLQAEELRSMHQFLNTVDLDNMVQRDRVETRGNNKRSHAFTETEQSKRIKLSTEEYFVRSNKELGGIALGNEIDRSRVNDDQVVRHSSFCEKPGRENNDGMFQVSQPQIILVIPEDDNGNTIRQANSPGVGEPCPNVVSADNNFTVCNDILFIDDDNVGLVENGLTARLTCSQDGNLQLAPKTGHGEISNPSSSKKISSNIRISVIPNISRDGDPSNDVPSDVD